MGILLPPKTDAGFASGLFRCAEWAAGLDAGFIGCYPISPPSAMTETTFHSTLRTAAPRHRRLSISCQKRPFSASAIIYSVIAVLHGLQRPSFWRLLLAAPAHT